MTKIILTLLLCILSLYGYAKEHTVEMLNSSDGESMVFKPTFLKAEVGDVVLFKPTSKGHNSESLFTPKDATTWKGKISSNVEVKLNKEGIYIYQCQNHSIMGMVGLIQVGKASNLKASKKFYQEFKKKIVMNKNRLDTIINEIKN